MLFMQRFNWPKINQIKHNFDIILHISPINKTLILNNLHFIVLLATLCFCHANENGA